MDAGVPRVEFETLGRIASAVANTRENRAPSDKNQRISAFLAQLHQLGRLKSDRLLAVGVRILRFRDGLLHTKSMVIDREITVFGTVNLDLRSFELNFEVSLIAYDREFSEAMRALQQTYENRASILALEEWQARPRLRRLLENAVQTMSPLL